ncbi:CapA family protein [Candidatus Saccharibacteria bacterium]|nr:CapA family protein [Candidatus Saccharibacteria bacterium]
MLAAGFWVYKNLLAPTTPEQAANRLQFDASVSPAEQQKIQQAIIEQEKTYRGAVSVNVETKAELEAGAAHNSILSAYVPVTNVYAVRQMISPSELSDIDLFVPADTDDVVRSALAKTLGIDGEKLQPLSGPVEELDDEAVAFVPAEQLSPQIKLLALDDKYYLDSFTSGAVFRYAVFSGGMASGLSDLALNDYPTKETTLKVNMTGVTALTREMMRKMHSVGGPTFFSEKIGPFLADADITHVSNEVSFKENCEYSATRFCSPPEMIEALKASGVDLVELTGNHNNDVGSQYNTETINLYHSLGWHTVGGGLNAEEARKPYIADLKGSKVAFLAYNFADAPASGAIAGPSTAGANPFSFEAVESDVAAAKQQADFVIVNIQYWECYAYPDGYVEFPECDAPIGQQAEVFRQVIDLGADMVIGSSAHQPQTYELYKGKPIYYGLGNLYFDQTRWPGTERGIILTHYFVGGKLIQTKLSPTVYDKNFQTRLMTNDEATYLLRRLQVAR